MFNSLKKEWEMYCLFLAFICFAGYASYRFLEFGKMKKEAIILAVKEKPITIYTDDNFQYIQTYKHPKLLNKHGFYKEKWEVKKWTKLNPKNLKKGKINSKRASLSSKLAKPKPVKVKHTLSFLGIVTSSNGIEFCLLECKNTQEKLFLTGNDVIGEFKILEFNKNTLKVETSEGKTRQLNKGEVLTILLPK